MTLTWEQLELPVLLWAVTIGGEATGELPHGSQEPFEPVPEVTQAGVEEALTRMEEFGLINGKRIETSDYTEWHRISVTADGLRVLGEWPPHENATLQQALVSVLLQLADDLPEEEARSVKRAAGGLARFAGNVVGDVTQAELKRLGGDAVT